MSTESTVPEPEPRSRERLDSWKEIAVYLKRGLRTVQQWEKDEGLPVHRHQHRKQGTVYAYRDEIDAWWEQRRCRLDASLSGKKSRAGKPLVWALVAAFALLGAWLVSRSLEPNSRGAPSSTAPWVLVASVELPAQGASVGEELEKVIERELAASNFLRVAPRARVEQVLKRTRRSVAGRLDSDLAREVCLRDGDIRAFVRSRLARAGDSYRLTLDLVDPVEGSPLATETERVERLDEVPGAVRLQARRMSENLQAMSLAPSARAQRLEKVTTSSLRALQLYSEAMTLGYRNQWKASEELFREALRHDPEFAAAYLGLGWSLWGQGERSGEHLELAERARGLAETGASEHERQFIGGTYSWMKGDYARATAAYEAALRIEPDQPLALNNLGFLYSWAGRPSQAVAQFVRQAALKPDDLHSNVLAAQALAIWTADSERARPYFIRARELATPEATSRQPYWGTWASFSPAFEQWLAGDLDGTSSHVAGLGDTISSRGGERDETTIFTGLFYLSLGMLGAAEEAFQGLSEAEGRNHHLALVALARNDLDSMKHHLRVDWNQNRLWRHGGELLLSRAGLFREAQELLAKLQRTRVPQAFLEVGEGELRLRRGKAEEAIEPLEAAVAALLHTGHPLFFLGSESLSEAFEQRGELARSVHVLEVASRERRRAYPTLGPTGFYWLRIQARLAQLYRHAGREEDAKVAEAELRRFLARADSAHPLREARRSGALMRPDRANARF